MNYGSLKKDELKNLCRKNNLPTEGIMKELISRLNEFEINKNADSLFPSAPPIIKTDYQNHPITLFIHIKASNFPYFLNLGVITCLSLIENNVYKDENRKKDILSYFPEYLILSKKPIGVLEEVDVMVEIDVVDLDFKETTIEGLYYLADPIPLSRLNGLIFRSISAKNLFLSSMKSFPDSFIPDTFCFVSGSNPNGINFDFNSITLPINDRLEFWTTKLRQYDKILGMFSFMKNTSILYAENENYFQEYSNGYFYAIGLINNFQQIEQGRDNSVFRYILFPNEIDPSNVQRYLFIKLLNAIYGHNDLNFDISIKILNEALNSNLATKDEERDLYTFIDNFNKLNRQQITFRDLLQTEAIKKNYPILGLLFLTQFPNKSKSHTDKQAVRNIFILNLNSLNKNTSDYLLGLLGLYYGYKNMIKEDTNLRFADRIYLKFADELQSIKIKKFSRFDKVVIESIFNFCKHGKPLSAEYIDLQTKQINTAKQIKRYDENGFDYVESYISVYDTEIITVERKNKFEILFDSIVKIYPAVISGRSFLLHYLISKFGVERNLIIDVLKTNIKSIKFEEIEKIADLDKNQISKG